MARLLFISLPLRGHLDWGGMLATASALARQGSHAVAWASGPAVQPAVAQAGVDFLELHAAGWLALPPLPAGLPAAELAALRQHRALDAWLSPDAVLPAVQALQRVVVAWRPDALVTEPYAAAGALAAEQAGLPLMICGRPGLASTPGAVGAAGQRARELCQLAGVAGAYWDLASGQPRSPLLHVDFFSRRWYADLAAVAPQTCFAGSDPAAPAADPLHPPTVLVTLGSLFNQDPAFFRIAAEAVLLAGGQPLLATGGEAVPPGLPAGAAVQPWVDFAAVLPRLAGVIHHGGVGTTHAALRHGLPQVAVPHAGDQRPQAGRITQAQVGFGVQPADFTPAAARWLARQLLENGDLRRQAKAWQAELAGLGGVAAAVRAIERAL